MASFLDRLSSKVIRIYCNRFFFFGGKSVLNQSVPINNSYITTMINIKKPHNTYSFRTKLPKILSLKSLTILWNNNCKAIVAFETESKIDYKSKTRTKVENIKSKSKFPTFKKSVLCSICF